MTRHAAQPVRKPSARKSLLRSCALIVTFGGGTAVIAAILAAPAPHRSPAAPTAALGAPSLPSVPVAAKEARVHTPKVAIVTPHPAARPHHQEAAARNQRLTTLMAAIPRPAAPTSPLPLSHLAALDAAAAASFVAPVAVPLPAPVRVAALAAESPVVLASLSAAVKTPLRPEVIEDHVETQLPELKPESAVAALTQAIDDAAIPLPAARPERILPIPPRRRGLPSPNVLAYARPDAGIEAVPDVEETAPMQGLGRGVAVYDISAATVYLPNGEKLEAHSGLGRMRDDPSQVHQKNRGPTPPHTYDLKMRESLFHGVEAIRLNPVGGQQKIHNRDGLLAHTYMLGKGGDSNGCVSFKDYKRFLAAFKRGDVKRLVVVSSMRSSRLARPKSLIASLFSRKS